MNSVLVKLGSNGRLVIPSDYRQALGLKDGGNVIITLESAGLRVTTPELAIKQAQTLVRQYVPEGVSLVDELLAERRREAARS
ncbi:MAG: AbrB/MazE/SpoVT family DNA-binding domain-containing protein [Truepera sp.]|nr:AbrB/MazE/SpoVT family DNA-binding domain-containing protein [Truepera sp.]